MRTGEKHLTDESLENDYQQFLENKCSQAEEAAHLKVRMECFSKRFPKKKIIFYFLFFLIILFFLKRYLKGIFSCFEILLKIMFKNRLPIYDISGNPYIR